MLKKFISNRIFDLSDVAKDLWGLWLGNIVIFFLINNGEIWKQFKIYHKTAKEYFSSPLSLILLQGVFSFIFMYFSAKLTDSIYWLELALLVIIFCIIAFYLIHFSQKKLIRKIIISAFSLLIISLSISFIINKDMGISSISDGIIIYKGLPIIYFDLLLTPDGGIHLVDKKEHLKKGDFLKLYDFQPDIIITAHTEQGNSPNRLYHYNPMKNTYFTYNPYTKTGVQILNLNYVDAIKEYNRLSKIKRTAIVIHNSHTNVN